LEESWRRVGGELEDEFCFRGGEAGGDGQGFWVGFKKGLVEDAGGEVAVFLEGGENGGDVLGEFVEAVASGIVTVAAGGDDGPAGRAESLSFLLRAGSN